MAPTEVYLRLARRVWGDSGQFGKIKFTYHAARREVAKASSKKAGEKEKVSIGNAVSNRAILLL